MGCLESIVPRHDDALVDWWLRCRLLLHANARPTFDTAILLTAWCVWKERNNRTFNRSLAGLHAMFLAVIREVTGPLRDLRRLTPCCLLGRKIPL